MMFGENLNLLLHDSCLNLHGNNNGRVVCAQRETLLPELGTRQHCRDNMSMTTFPGQTIIVHYGIMSIYSLWLLHLDTPRPSPFFIFFLVSTAPLRCRIVVVAKLNQFRVPSAACYLQHVTVGVELVAHLLGVVDKGHLAL